MSHAPESPYVRWRLSRVWAATALVCFFGCSPQGEVPPVQAIGDSAFDDETNLAAAVAVPASPLEPFSLAVDGALTPSAATADDGVLWVAYAKEGRVYVDRSLDAGSTFLGPTAVNAVPEAIETNGEGRPKIAVSDDGDVFVSWTRKLERRFTGEIRFARSTDGARSFEAVQTINDDGLAIGHRFDSLIVDRTGHVYVAWIDKRDQTAARERGDHYRGAALYYAVSVDGGVSFSENYLVAGHACECCRIAIAQRPDRGIVVLWRHIFEPNVRDHAVAELGPEGPLGEFSRASFEEWAIDACPHHGPALAVTDGGHVATWFSAGDGPAIYAGRIQPETGHLNDVERIADGGANHPHIVSLPGRVIVVWRSADDDGHAVWHRESADGGATWSAPQRVARTDGGSDHPFATVIGGRPFLRWHTERGGLRFVPIDNTGDGAT